MDKATSVLGALDAGKLPSTQQFNLFIDWLNDVGIASLEPAVTQNLTSQGRVLADRLHEIFDAYKQLAANKNGDFPPLSHL